MDTMVISSLTPARTHSISGLKSGHFWLKKDGKSGLHFFYFEIQRAPPELLLPSTKKP